MKINQQSLHITNYLGKILESMKKISKQSINNIKALLAKGVSVREVAKRTGISKSKVGELRQSMNLEPSDTKKGRPAKLSEADDRVISRLIRSGKADTAVQVAQHLNNHSGQTLSASTIRRSLKKQGMKAVVKKKKPMLSKFHRKARLAFAEKYKEYTEEDWKQVIWSDESKINRLGSDGQKYTWKRAGEPLLDREVIGTKKFGGGNIMVWGCMGWTGVGKMVYVEGKMDAEQYCSILDDGLLGTLEKFQLEVEDIIFQQDNDPKHTSKLATKWFQDQNITLLSWPAQSPDLNPIEHLWGILKRKIYDYEFPAEGVDEIWQRAAEAWSRITPEEVQNLISSMPRRIAAVIRAKGGHTKY